MDHLNNKHSRLKLCKLTQCGSSHVVLKGRILLPLEGRRAVSGAAAVLVTSDNRFQCRTRPPVASCPTCPGLQDLTGADSSWDPGEDLVVLVFRDQSYPQSQSDLH